MITLRPNQKAFIHRIAGQFAHGSRAPLGVAPTGMGKTVCLSFMTGKAREKSNTVGIVAHRQELISQTSMALAQTGIVHNIIAPEKVVSGAIKDQIRLLGKSFFNRDAKAMVCSVQTLARRLDRTDPFDFLMIDEAHHAVAGQWMKVIEAMPRAKLLGVTATPERLDGQGLGVDYGGVFTSMAMGPGVQELIDDGFLVAPVVFGPPRQFSLEGVRTRGRDFNPKDASQQIDKPSITGDVISHYNRICPGIPAIAFCASVDHARHVAGQFRAAGYRSVCVEGEMLDTERRNAIEGLGSGRIDVLTSCDIISEGTDVPVVGAAILLRPTKSLSLHLQQVGRVLRPFDGKDRAFVLDHVGNSDRLGFAEDEREWSLEGRKKRRNRSEDCGPPVRQCMKCYAMYRAFLDACPACGSPAVRERKDLEHKDGELVEINKTAFRHEKKREQARAQTLDDLIELGRRRGYKNPDAWAKHVFRARQSRERSRA